MVNFAEPIPGYFFAGTTGNNSGVTNAIGDYSSTETDFYIEAPPGEILKLQALIVHIEDTGGFRINGYGNLNGGVTNGIRLIFERDGVNIGEVTQVDTIKTHGDWSRYAFDLQHNDFGAGSNQVVIRWNLSLAPFRLKSETNDRIIIRLNDDFSHLEDHTFFFYCLVDSFYN